MARNGAAATLGQGRGGGVFDQHRDPDFKPKIAKNQPRRRDCRQPESPDGRCASPITCPCAEVELIDQLCDLAERGRAAIRAAAVRLGMSEKSVRELVQVRLDRRRRMSPEMRAAQEGRRHAA